MSKMIPTPTNKVVNQAKNRSFTQLFTSDRMICRASVCQLLTQISNIMKISGKDTLDIINTKYEWCLVLGPIFRKIVTFCVFLRENLSQIKGSNACFTKMFRKTTTRPSTVFSKIVDITFDSLPFLVRFLCDTLYWKMGLTYSCDDEDITEMVKSILISVTLSLIAKDIKDITNYIIYVDMLEIYNNEGMGKHIDTALDIKMECIRNFSKIDEKYLRELESMHDNVRKYGSHVADTCPEMEEQTSLKRKLDDTAATSPECSPSKIRKIASNPEETDTDIHVNVQYMETPIAHIVNIPDTPIPTNRTYTNKDTLIIIPDESILLGNKIVVYNDNFSSNLNKDILTSAFILVNGQMPPEHGHLKIPKGSILMKNTIYKKDLLNNRYVPL